MSHYFAVIFVSRLLCDYHTASCKIILFAFPLIQLVALLRGRLVFLSETECKGNAFFWPAKTFQKKFQTIYYLAFDLLQHPVSLESGCKSRHFFITIQIFPTLFSHIFQTFFLRIWIWIILKLKKIIRQIDPTIKRNTT